MSSQSQSGSSGTTKKIKKRVITLGNIKKASVNKNCPKFIVGHCWMANKGLILKQCSPQEASYLKSAFEVVQRWIQEGSRDSLNLTHLISLFGKSQNVAQKRGKFYCAKAFYKFLSENILEIMMKNKRVSKTLSYLICLQKFTARLGHPQLIYKLQFK